MDNNKVTSLEGLTRYDYAGHNCYEARNGHWVKFADVERLLATQASIPAGGKLNINDSFEVTLTARGAQTRNDHYAWMREKHPNVAPKLSCEGDVLKDQLWELMKIFGPSIHLGMEVPFANCEMRVVGKPAAPTSQAEPSDELLALHRQLAAETLRANQGWERAEAKSRECIELRERIASQAEPVVDGQQVVAVPVAWMNPREGFVRDAFIWSQDDRHPEYSQPVYAAPSSLPMAADARDQVLEEAAKVAEAQNRVGYEWVKDSVWDNIIKRVPTAIRALKAQRPASQEGVSDA